MDHVSYGVYGGVSTLVLVPDPLILVEYPCLDTWRNPDTQPYEPNFSDAHYTLAGQREVLEKAQMNWDTGAG